MADKKRSFVMYNDYLQHFEILSKNEQADLIMLILRYTNGMDIAPEELSGSVRMAFSFIRRRLDDDHEKYEEICKKRARSVSKRYQKSTNEYTCIQMYTSDTDNVNENDSDNEYDNVSDNDNVVVVAGENDAQPAGPAEASTVTTTTTDTGEAIMFPPTEEQVREYCTERNNTVDPVRFIDYYSTNGWKVGKNPMKDWKAAVRVWEAREKNTPSRASPAYAPSYDLDEIREHNLRKYRDL